MRGHASRLSHTGSSPGDSSQQARPPVLSAADPTTFGPGFPRWFAGKYMLLKETGRGGMGNVYMGLSGARTMRRVCAIKPCLRTGVVRVDTVTRFLDEARIVTQLSHENLVYVFDAGTTDADTGATGTGAGPASPANQNATPQPYLAMEFIAGKTLRQVWNRSNPLGSPFLPYWPCTSRESS